MNDEFVISVGVHFHDDLVDDGLVAPSLRVNEVVLNHVERTKEQRDQAETEFGRIPENGPNVRTIDGDQDHLEEKNK